MSGINRDNGELNINGRKLTGWKAVNIILGKNGCGKSSLLRDLKNTCKDIYNISYISPERAGQLTYDSNVLQNMRVNLNWLDNTRDTNQVSQFKQQSYQKILQIINIALQNYQSETEKAKKDNPQITVDQLKIPTSEEYLEKINKLLDETLIISIDESGNLVIKDSNRELSNISSGEAEIIALAAECLLCFIQLKSDSEKKGTILLLDEPDVHLHPDLQYRFIKFLLEEIKDKQNVQIFIATHSTPILSALADYNEATVAFLNKYNTQRSEEKLEEIAFYSINEQLQNILPVFGAHPLTSIYMNSPLLLVEGDTDWTIWQQAIRSSRGKIRLHPVVCGADNKIDLYEKTASQVLTAVYDQEAKAYSLRDKDNRFDNNAVDQYNSVKRLMLNCRESENLLLTNEVLESLGKNWEQIKKEIDIWLDKSKSHEYYAVLSKFASEGYDRQNYKIKDVVNILLYFMNSNKPWTFIIGQVIGKLEAHSYQDEEGSIYKFLGKDLLDILASFDKK